MARSGAPVRRESGVVLSIMVLLAACGGPSGSPTPQPPRDVIVTVVDRGRQRPIAGAELSAGALTTTTGADGTATLTALRGASIRASADGFDAASGPVPNEGGLSIALRANVVTGRVTEARPGS